MKLHHFLEMSSWVGSDESTQVGGDFGEPLELIIGASN